ncbi:hypothetical protein HNP84_009748 [Thermocatellispora tengchongensis]|uniref:HK97 gp10 family phage protein n=1 Tax=Thermocatellispora tengchongensis TaxID=1073253 RepID=A0A840PPJ4_9ACTN|nr:hypothetical protein [Thermocatellispora tengchongensis]MBB5139983.1 hypothetical protein [Thermocatellispora tengchongensis]
MVFNAKVNPEDLMAEIHRASGRGLRLATEHVLAVSNQRVPHDEGTLERSGTAVVDETNLRGIVSYDTPYAVAQHETLDYQHKPGRTAKFLELAVREEAEVVKLLIAKQLRQVFK